MVGRRCASASASAAAPVAAMRTKVEAGGGDVPPEAGYAPRDEDRRLAVVDERRTRSTRLIDVVDVVVAVARVRRGAVVVLDPTHLQQRRALPQSRRCRGGGRRRRRRGERGAVDDAIQVRPGRAGHERRAGRGRRRTTASPRASASASAAR